VCLVCVCVRLARRIFTSQEFVVVSLLLAICDLYFVLVFLLKIRFGSPSKGSLDSQLSVTRLG